MATCGEVLVNLLEGYGVDQVFGIPGVHTVELYLCRLDPDAGDFQRAVTQPIRRRAR